MRDGSYLPSLAEQIVQLGIRDVLRRKATLERKRRRGPGGLPQGLQTGSIRRDV